MNYLSVIERVLVEASEIATSKFGKVSGTVKPEDPNQVLTEADLAIGRHIVSALAEQFPQHNIIDEEAGVIDNGSDHTWVIDPIDGTSNFAEGIPLYGIIVGLIHKGRALTGGIALPAFSEIYLGQTDAGSFCNGAPISVTRETDLSRCLVAFGVDGNRNQPQDTFDQAAIFGNLALSVRNVRATGCVYNCTMVAKGSFGAALNQSTALWDIVGVQPIIEGAGGVFTDFWGEPIDYSEHIARAAEKFPFCASGPGLVREIQSAIRRTPTANMRPKFNP